MESYDNEAETSAADQNLRSECEMSSSIVAAIDPKHRLSSRSEIGSSQAVSWSLVNVPEKFTSHRVTANDARRLFC